MAIWSRKTTDLPLVGITPGALSQLLDVWRSTADACGGVPDALPVEPLKALLPNLLLFDIEGELPTARYRIVGPALKQLLGRDPTGLTVDEAYPEEIADEIMAAIRRVLRQRGPVCTRNEYKILVRLFGYTRLMVPLFGMAGEVKRIVVAIYPLGSALRSAREWQEALAEADEARWNQALGKGGETGDGKVGGEGAGVWLV